MEKEEIKYINYQLIGLGITLITTVIAIIITYNQKLGTAKKEKILSNKDSLKLICSAWLENRLNHNQYIQIPCYSI